MSADYEAGKLAAKAWHESPAYLQYRRDLPATDIIALFMPPIENDMMQLQRPLPKKYQEWISGFNENRDES